MTARRLGWAGAALAGVVLLGSLAWGLGHAAGASRTTVLGRPAPDLVVERLDGGQVRLSQLRGQPVVVNFWASWCAPCRQEEDVLKRAAERWRGSVAFLGVDIQDSPAAGRAHQAQAQYPYPVGPAAGGVSPAYGVTGPPETFFIDGRGVVVARFLGPLDTSLMDRYLQLVGVR